MCTLHYYNTASDCNFVCIIVISASSTEVVYFHLFSGSHLHLVRSNKLIYAIISKYNRIGEMRHGKCCSESTDINEISRLEKKNTMIYMVYDFSEVVAKL